MYRWIDHTAEVELEIEAGSRQDVFAEALSALAELLGCPDPGALASGRRGVRASGRDAGSLLSAWLEELVFLAESQGFVATELIEIELRPDVYDLRALVGGFLGDPPPLVKAVTLHRLLFERRADGYAARVVLDV